jgi:hypothetical protein
MTRMDPTIKAKWVAALRSGEYQQAHGTLRAPNAHNCMCCLGVLCDLYAKESGGTHWSGLTLGAKDEEVHGPVVAAWAHLLPEAGVSIGGKEARLYDHNDGNTVPARTFAEIADAIEQQL